MPNRKVPSDDLLRKMYESGLSSTEIAKELGLNPTTVSHYMWRNGLITRSSSETNSIQRKEGRRKESRYWLGRKQPRELVEKRVSKIRGEKHYLWKGGESRRGYRNVVEKVKCATCGSKENLGIHHRDNDHFNNSPDNLEVLCVSCHMSKHKSEYWEAIHSGKEPQKSNGPVGWNK